MSQPVVITGAGNKTGVLVTSRGELIVAPIEYSTSYQAARTTAGTTTVVAGKAGKRFILTSIFLAQDKSNIDTHVTLFESDDKDSATEDNIIFETDFQRNQVLVATGLDIITESVKWINIKTDVAAGISITLAGYYIDA